MHEDAPSLENFPFAAELQEGLLDLHLWDGAVQQIVSQLQSVEGAQRAVGAPGWWNGACRGR